MSLMVGVSGIRGIVGETMTPQLAVRAACAMGAFCDKGRVLVGRDSRPSGTMLRSAVISGLLASGCEVIDLGVITTPGVGVMVGRLHAAGALMLTASHNPAPWNGIKFITADGSAPSEPVARRIIDIFEGDAFALADHDHIGTPRTDDGGPQHHVDTVLKIVDADTVRRQGFHVVLDSVNGSGGPTGRGLLERLGCRVTHINGDPTGRFAHTPEPIAENLTGLGDEVRRSGAHVGFAQDPDADRLAVVDETGAFIGEEYTFALGAMRVLETRPGPVAANLSTSRMIDDIAARMGSGCTVHRSPVGEANVVAAMKEHQCVVGGEGNGGLIDPRVVDIRDSMTSMAIILELMATRGQPLSDIVATIPRYVMVKQKFPCDRPRIGRVLERLRTAFDDARVSTIDGVRMDWPTGWVHVRGSNTEPIMRVIGESADDRSAERLVEKVRRVVDQVE